MLTRERRSLVPPSTLPDFGRTALSGLPPQATLPRSRRPCRAALFGAVTVASVTAVPAVGRAAVLSANDARLVAIADELRSVFERTRHLSATLATAENAPEWGSLIDRFSPLEQEMADLPADTMAGVLAKARASQVPPVANCINAIGDSIAADLMRLFGAEALS